MTTRELRVVSSDAVVGSVGWDGDTLTLGEVANDVFAAHRARIPDDVLGPRLIEDGWSNGYLYLADATEVDDGGQPKAGK